MSPRHTWGQMPSASETTDAGRERTHLTTPTVSVVHLRGEMLVLGSNSAVSARVAGCTPRPRPCVLCVDDDSDVSLSIALRLNCYDVDVLRAQHGMQGKWLAEVARPDVIVTDLRMPLGDGEYLVECLKKNACTADIPVIVLTGRREPGLQARLSRWGAIRLLTKPVAFAELERELTRIIALRRTTPEDEASSEREFEVVDGADTEAPETDWAQAVR